MFRVIRQFREKTRYLYAESEQRKMEPWKKKVMELHAHADFLFYFEEVEPEPDSLLTEMQEETDVYGAVLQLPQKYRTAIHLYYYEGYSVREIAQMTGSTEPAVKSQLFRARELLREQLKGEFIDV